MTFTKPRSGVFIGMLAATAFAAAAVGPSSADARTLEAIKQRGKLMVCANPNALPFSSKKADRPGFELELGEALAKQLGVALEIGWVIFPMHVARVDCDILFDFDRRSRDRRGCASAAVATLYRERGGDRGASRN